jgi:signal peptidase II
MSRNRERSPYFAIGIAVAIITLLIDQSFRYCMLQVVEIGRRPPIEVTGFFNLLLTWNYGVSFGMLSRFGTASGPILLSGLALVIVAILLVWLRKNQRREIAYALGLIIGGALGNVIDRSRFGAVADFFDLHAFGYHWPAFNVADIAIFMGVMLCCIPASLSRRRFIE